jgi:coproporphyrinogen III oxidase
MQKLFNVGKPIFACGLSLVLHQKKSNGTPRFMQLAIEMYDENGNIKQWFGGGQDLTPYYLFEEDAIFSSNLQNSL